MDTQLGKTQYLAGNDYTIADIATFPWTALVAKPGRRTGRISEREALA